MHRISAVILALCLLFAAACGSASAATHWHDLKRVTITVAQPSLPPPGGEPHTARYTTAKQLAKVTKALNADHIALRNVDGDQPACTGGYELKVVITPSHGHATTLSSYVCGNDAPYGSMAGNVRGFAKTLNLF